MGFWEQQRCPRIGYEKGFPELEGTKDIYRDRKKIREQREE
jgi:hypothetical protein